jgi:HTH-type transcriptional regulator/antitoxin HigA
MRANEGPIINLIKEPMKKIINDAEYHQVTAKIDSLMAKGSDKVSKEELAEIRSLAQAAQAYEQTKYVIDPPSIQSTLF